MSNHLSLISFFLFFFNDTATTEIYTLSLHDALPISSQLDLLHPREQYSFFSVDGVLTYLTYPLYCFRRYINAG